MTESNEVSTSDVPAPPPFDGLEERCAAIPWEVRGRKVYGSFWRTVMKVLAHPGRLGELIDQPVSPKEAKDFRKMVVLHLVSGITVPSLVAVLMSLQDHQSGINSILIGCATGIFIIWLIARSVIGASRWFFSPPQLSPAQQESSLALSYYLTGPLALAPLSWLSLLLAFGQPVPSLLFTLICGGVQLAALVWYFAVVVIGLRKIARRRGRNLAMSAIGMSAIWLTICAGLLLAPPFIVMWLLMYGSLA